MIPLILRVVPESKGQNRGVDPVGMALGAGAVTLGVLAIMRAAVVGWGAPAVLGLFALAAVLLIVFVRWERTVATPLVPLRFFRIPDFVLSNLVSLATFFGIFGSIFFLTQYLQGPMGFSPLEAALRTLPWTVMPMLAAPVAGAIIDKVGGGSLMALGLAMQAAALVWLALILGVDLQYYRLVPAMVLAGLGVGLVLVPTVTVVLSSVQENEFGTAVGANNTVREIGGVLGVAVLGTVFSAHFAGRRFLSSVEAYSAFVKGMTSALWVGSAVVGAAAIAALFIRRRHAPTPSPATDPKSLVAKEGVGAAGGYVG